ncbi:MAG TPA: hypothetical protein VNF48_00920, partial [Gammaproteobacteria bacterium]|nr:hypothetical protein [Gammaproteobacteria bacterium]
GRALLAKQIADNQRTQQLQNQTIVQNTLALQKFLFNHQQDIQILQNTIQLQKQTIAQNTMALQKLLFDHGQQIQNQNISIGNLQSQLGNIQDNRALGDPLRSLTPVGLGRIAILAIGIVLSFFIALIAALFAGYVEQVRVRLASPKNT